MGSFFFLRENYMGYYERENYLDWKRPSRNKYQMRSRFKPCDSLLTNRSGENGSPYGVIIVKYGSIP